MFGYYRVDPSPGFGPEIVGRGFAWRAPWKRGSVLSRLAVDRTRRTAGSGAILRAVARLRVHTRRFARACGQIGVDR